jgi:hypothetical protein
MNILTSLVGVSGVAFQGGGKKIVAGVAICQNT